MSKKHKEKELHDAYGLPGALVTECEKCEALMREVKDLKHSLKALEKLADWYDQTTGPNIASHRIRQALEGKAP